MARICFLCTKGMRDGGQFWCGGWNTGMTGRAARRRARQR